MFEPVPVGHVLLKDELTYSQGWPDLKLQHYVERYYINPLAGRLLAVAREYYKSYLIVAENDAVGPFYVYINKRDVVEGSFRANYGEFQDYEAYGYGSYETQFLAGQMTDRLGIPLHLEDPAHF